MLIVARSRHCSPILRRYASKLASRANRTDDRACNAGQDSCALLVTRADIRTLRIARAIGFTIAPGGFGKGNVLKGRRVDTRDSGPRPESRPRLTAGRVGPGTGKSRRVYPSRQDHCDCSMCEYTRASGGRNMPHAPRGVV